MESHPARQSERCPSRGRGRARLRGRAAGLALTLLGLFVTGCGPGSDSDPDATPGAEAVSEEAEGPDPRAGLSLDARLDTHAMLVADAEAPRHPGDGGGRAWLETENGPQPVPAATAARLVVVFEAGPEGVAEGGMVFLQPSPFWEWDPPQVRSPEAPGYTTFETDASGVTLSPDDSTGAFLMVEIGGRALVAGERIRFVYGEGDLGARVDRYAEESSPLYVAVDADGDGVRSMLDVLPRIDVAAREPSRLHAVWPTTAEPGDSVTLRVAALDALGSPSRVPDGAVAIEGGPAGATVPATLELGPGGHGRVTVDALPEGIHTLVVRGTGALTGMSAITNPLVVRAGIGRVLWGDLHGHSQLSDGTGTPDQYHRYARDVAGLDVVALTDHDHWGMRPLDAEPRAWQSIRESVDRFHEPGRFVALLGYEWTSWLHGHRHVLYFDSASQPATVLSSLDPRYDTPAELWDALRGRDVLTFAHHSAGGPVSTNWRHYPPDPELETVTEIVSVHGSSEAPDAPIAIYDPVPGNFVRNAMDAGYVLGFIGSGDSHDGHPGLVQLATAGASGGLAALRSETHTRAGVLEALRARHTYATNGERIWLDVTLDGQPMGTMLPATEEAEPPTRSLVIEIVGTAPIERVDLVRSGHVASIDGEGRSRLELVREVPALARGEYHYVRVVQEDGGAAWSSPIFAR